MEEYSMAKIKIKCDNCNAEFEKYVHLQKVLYT